VAESGNASSCVERVGIENKRGEKRNIKLTESEGAKTVWFPCCRRGMRVAAFVVANEAKVVKLQERKGEASPHW